MHRSAALAVALAVGCGCGVAATDDGGVDAAADAPDAADAPRDAPSADSPDAPIDGGPDDPGWIALDGYPEGCGLAYATNPAALFTPEWTVCEPASVTGCRWLPQDPRYVEQGFGDASARWFDGSIGYFAAHLRAGPASAQVATVVLARTEGAPVAAFRTPIVTLPDGSACSGLGVGMTGPGSAADSAHYDRDANDIRHDLLHGPLSAWEGGIPPMMPLTAAIVPRGSRVSELHASDTTAAFAVRPAGWIVVVEGDRWVIRGGPTSPITGYPDETALHGHDVFWMSWYEGATDNDVWLVHASIDVDAHPLVTAPGSMLWGLGTDGNHLCWMVETDRRLGEPYRGDLYCSPYATETSALSPALVRASVPITITGTVGTGLYALADWDEVDLSSTLYVFDIADGTARRFVAPANWRFSGVPLWVTPTETAVPLRVISTTGGAPFDTLVRIDLAAFESLP